MKKKLKFIASGFLAFLIVATSSVSGSATVENRQTLRDSSSDGGSSLYTELVELEVATESDDSDLVYVWIGTELPVYAYDFTDGRFAGLDLDVDLDGSLDFTIYTDETPYESGRISHTLSVWNPVLEEYSGCTAETWVDLDSESYWVGFQFSKSCLGISQNSLNIQAFSSDPNSDDASGDFIPNGNNFGVFDVSAASNSSLIAPLGYLPTLAKESLYRTPTPGKQPNDLVSTAESVGKSVVTIFCADSSGTGWSADAKLSADLTKAGIESVLVTNYHVVADCTEDNLVTVELSNGSRESGYIWSYDSELDLASILLYVHVPSLPWRGETPKQGWWVGTIGNPLGISSSLTTGIVSKVDVSAALILSTTPINPGNSGGPLFDRMGRVVGVVTAKLNDTENMGLIVGAEALCEVLFNCGSAKAWSAKLKAMPTKTYNSCSAMNKDFAGGLKKSIATRNKGAQTTLRALVSSSVYLKNKKLDKDRDGIACEK